jgi:mycothiol synthase
MVDTRYQFVPFDRYKASEGDYRRLWELDRQIRAERLPDDPPLPFDDYMARQRSMPPFFAFQTRLVSSLGNDDLVAMAEIGYDIRGENAHLAQFDIAVLPAYRRQGLGRRLLGWICEAAEGQQRRLLLSQSHAQIPAGTAFFTAMQAHPGLEARVSQLIIADLDREMIRAWINRAPERAIGFELGFWNGHYPEQDLAAIAEMVQVMNTAPRGDLEFDDETFNPEELRAIEALHLAGGRQRLTAYVREQATGRLAGYSEVFYSPSQPTLLHQGATGVLPAYRNRGLGRWLKAAMIEQVLHLWPDVCFVRTDNAETNAPMLSINVQMGFRPYTSSTIWQIETARARVFGDSPHAGAGSVSNT